MPTHQAKQLLFPSSSLAWSDRYFAQGPALLPPSLHKRTCLLGHARLELRMANCVGRCVGIIEDINRDDVLKCWSEYRSSLWHKNVRYLPSAVATKTWVVRLKLWLWASTYSDSQCKWLLYYCALHVKLKGLGAPRKFLKIDSLKLHFVALSEQHWQDRQVL